VTRKQGIASLLAQVLEKAQRNELYLLGPSVPSDYYAKWIERIEPSEDLLKEQRIMAQKLNQRPLFSIITPVWNPPLKLFSETLDSVVNQTYDNWELCIADGNSSTQVKALLEDFSREHENVRVEFLEKNLGISSNSNIAVNSSLGEFLTLLDHDDILASNALFEAARLLNQDPTIDIIYSDHDRMTADGVRLDPLFKPDWSPDMMLSANYIGHLCIIRSSLVKSLGAFRPEMDGAQDWDLLLRASEMTTRIGHIPKVLYHWREATTSVSAAGFHAKPYARNAQIETLNQCLQRNQFNAKAVTRGSTPIRLRWEDINCLVSIIVTSNANKPALNRCTGSIRKSSHREFEIIVVGKVEIKLDNAIFVQYDAACEGLSGYNKGAESASGEVLVFLNSDLEVLSADWLQELSCWALRDRVGAVGAMILTPDHRIYHGGIILGLSDYLFRGAREVSWSALGHTQWYRNLMAVSSDCMAVNQRVFKELGGFDNSIGPAADIAFCQSARKHNYRIVYTPHARLMTHNPGEMQLRSSRINQTFKDESMASSSDPYYNLNLSCKSSIPTLD
jgi:GT2 family glycosyltransferase